MLNTRVLEPSTNEARKSKADVKEKDHDEDKSEVLGNLVKVVVLILVRILSHVYPLSDFQTVKNS